jgi:poly(A) polymerase
MTPRKDRLAGRLFRQAWLRELSDLAATRGWELHLVGGAVRDAVWGRQPHDYDLIVGPPVEPVLSWLAQRSAHRPIRFEKRIRTHRFTVAGQLVDCVERAPRTLLQELRRRDFTIGAIAVRLGDRTVFDPLHGLRALQQGRVEPTRQATFRDDPLRMLRAIRLASEHPQLRPTGTCLRLIRRDATQIRNCSKERIGEEFDRILAAGTTLRSWSWLARCGLVTQLLPELARCRGVVQNRHHHLDVYHHTLAALAAADHVGRLGQGVLRPALDREALLILRWSLLCHDLGKPETRTVGPNGEYRFHGHERRSAELVGPIGARFAFSRERTRAVQRLVEHHLRIVVPATATMSDRALTRVVRDVDPWVELLALHTLADKRASVGVNHKQTTKRLRESLRQLLCLHERRRQPSRMRRLIDGHELQQLLSIEPSAQLGAYLKELDLLQSTGEITTRAQALSWARSLAAGDGPQ